ncbi:MAG: adenosylcobinamide-GDP ribazoletransferase [Alphaproteobacteria bacterium]|nr:adenosylcobinamide-GDP ribazoletransferase [Alphaproteobacteria bacterium]
MNLEDFTRDWPARRADARVALTFFTRLVWGERPAPALGELAAASWAFPLTGLVVGVCGALAYAIVARLGVPVPAAALLAVATTALVTAGQHEDGLARAVEGLGRGDDVNERLRLMRDGPNGALGVLAIVLSVGLRAGALFAVGDAFGTAGVSGALVGCHAIARGLLPAALRWGEPAAPADWAAEAGRPETTNVGAAAAIALVIALLALGIKAGLVAIVVAAAAMAAVAYAADRRIGGFTGDILNAVEQAGEIAVLLVAAAWT